MRTSGIPEPDRGLHVMTARRVTAMWKIGWMIVGIVVALGLLYFDIYFSADGMIPVFGETDVSLYMCWFLSIIMSPIELAGTAIRSEKYLKKELSGDAKTILFGIVIVVIVADVVTNWMGMWYNAIDAGVEIGVMYGLIIVLVGLGIAFIEYVIQAFVMVASKELANYKQATAWVQQWEAEHDDESPSRGVRSTDRGMPRGMPSHRPDRRPPGDRPGPDRRSPGNRPDYVN